MSKVHLISAIEDDNRTVCGRTLQEHMTGRLFLSRGRVIIVADPRCGDADVTCIPCIAANLTEGGGA